MRHLAAGVVTNFRRRISSLSIQPAMPLHRNQAINSCEVKAAGEKISAPGFQRDCGVKAYVESQLPLGAESQDKTYPDPSLLAKTPGHFREGQLVRLSFLPIRRCRRQSNFTACRACARSSLVLVERCNKMTSLHFDAINYHNVGQRREDCLLFGWGWESFWVSEFDVMYTSGEGLAPNGSWR